MVRQWQQIGGVARHCSKTALRITFMTKPVPCHDVVVLFENWWRCISDHFDSICNMSSAYGKIDRPTAYDAAKLASLLPIETKTKFDHPVTVHSLSTLLQDDRDESSLISYLQGLLNEEIQSGNTYPQKSLLSLTEFKNYFLSGDVFVVVKGGKEQSREFSANLQENILGTFYIKPNFPGRCSHVILFELSQFSDHDIDWFRFVMEDSLRQLLIETKASGKWWHWRSLPLLHCLDTRRRCSTWFSPTIWRVFVFGDHWTSKRLVEYPTPVIWEINSPIPKKNSSMRSCSTTVFTNIGK